MYDENGKYTTHPLGLPFEKSNFIPKGYYTFGEVTKLPDKEHYSSKNHYYVPNEAALTPSKGIPKLMTQEEFDNRVHVNNVQLIKPVLSDWPSPFINFYFPHRKFQQKYLQTNGLVGIAISKSGIKTDDVTSQIQNTFKINLVDYDGLTHMMIGVYCEDGQLVTECFGCCNKADGCLCGMKKKPKTNFSEELILADNNVAFQTCYDVPRIKGISCFDDYAILFLDKKEQKKKWY